MSKLWKQYEFWKKASNYSTVLIVVYLILSFSLNKSLLYVRFVIAIIGALTVLFLLLSEIMKFIIKKKADY